MYLMIVAGSLLDILANRFETLGHVVGADAEMDGFEIQRSFRVDYLQTYTKISRFDLF